MNSKGTKASTLLTLTLTLTMLLSILFFLLLLPISSFSSSQSPKHLKLPLVPSLPFPSLQQALSLDTLRLTSPIVSAASSGAGQYLVHLPLGTPPQPLRLVLDTGSDLLWARCSPCLSHCRRPHHPRKPSFFPRHSSSFSPLRCSHPPLRTPCRFRYSYAGNRLSTSGLLSRERSLPSLPSILFGCAFNTSLSSPVDPTFDSAHGVLGLGRGPVSFASQLSADRFSYCLMDYTLSPPPVSYLVFGPNPANTTALHHTPILSNPFSPTFYYIRILSAYVNRNRMNIPRSAWSLDTSTGIGGTILDSGTTLSFVPDIAYRAILKAVRKALRSTAFVKGPPGFDLCIDSSSSVRRPLPKLSFELAGGARFSPPPRNYFVEAAEGVKCLALRPVGDTGLGVLGNLMQQGFELVFDCAESRLGFAYTGCA